MKIVEAGGFAVVGRAARTSNAKEMSGQGAIPKLWMSMPPDRGRIALYAEYESDEHDAYTFVLGSKAGQGLSAGAGMVMKKVPRGRYAVFTSEQGPIRKVVVETWMKIWAMTEYERNFVADYEVHDERTADPDNAIVDIYVGVK